jgi:hypothetical protein
MILLFSDLTDFHISTENILMVIIVNKKLTINFTMIKDKNRISV